MVIYDAGYFPCSDKVLTLLELVERHYPLVYRFYMGELEHPVIKEYYAVAHTKISSKTNKQVYGPEKREGSAPHLWVSATTGKSYTNKQMECILKQRLSEDNK